MKTNPYIALLMGLLIATPVIAQGVWVPLDLDSQHYTIDKRMARKLGLWPHYEDVHEVQLLQNPDSSFTLVIRYYSMASPRDLLQNNISLSQYDVDELRRTVSEGPQQKQARKVKAHKKEILRKPIMQGNHRLVARIYGSDNKQHFQGRIIALEDSSITIWHRLDRAHSRNGLKGTYEQDSNTLTIPVSGITWIYIRRKGAVARGVLMGTAFAMSTAAISAAPSGDGLALTAWVFIAAPTGLIMGAPYGKRWSRFQIYGDSVHWKSMMDSISGDFE